jgi:diacylglycerol kinase (ATP)
VRVRAILNPKAGVAAERARRALEAGRPSWGPIELALTEGPGNARALARAAAEAGCDLVLAVGGDGTVNEVAAGLLGSPTALGVVPMGSGNGLARTLRLPLKPAPALAALEAGITRRMDVGRVNGEPFLNVAGAGFDAFVGEAFHQRGRNGGRRGILPYVWISLKTMPSYRAGRFSVTTGAGGFEGHALLVAFVNGRQYGGGATIAPGSRLDDGLFDVVVLEDAPWVELLAAAPRLFLGGIERFRRYRRFTVTTAEVQAPVPMLFHRDGEPEPAVDRLTVTLDPRALRVRVPRATSEAADGPFEPRDSDDP